MLTVLTWLWHQPSVRVGYTAWHVNIWADMVRRNLAMPHRVACVTDMPAGIDPSIAIIEPPREFEDWTIPSWGPGRPQCLRRIAMFAPDAAARFGDRFVCMDLDCVVSGPLDPLFDTDAEFMMFRGTAKGRPYNGSMILLQAGARPQVYARFDRGAAVRAGQRFVGSDQAWISACLGPGEKTWGVEHGAHNWLGRHPTEGTCRVMFFPGRPKPWDLVDVDEPFCVRHYRRDPVPRACLVLGYGANVWREADAALDLAGQGRRPPFDAVIASPEAARHWPGKLLAVAADDFHADRLAAMYGFDDVVFCGRSEGVPA